MANKWIDNNKYIGRDRREDRRKRLFDRRRLDATTEPPPLHAVLRRLRVLLHDSDPGARERALQLFAASAATATELGLPRCAGALQRAEQAFREADVDDAEALVAEAMNYVG